MTNERNEAQSTPDPNESGRVKAALEIGLAPGDSDNLDAGETAMSDSFRELLAELNLRDAQFLGGGGMGEAYKARRNDLSAQEVVLKLIRPDRLCLRADQSEEYIKLFRKEIMALASIAHPNIVQIYRADRSKSGVYYIEMEYAAGGNLADAMARPDWSPAKALALIPQLCVGLRAIHSKGIVHRDIKPVNLVFDARGAIKYTDFGLAKLDLSDAADQFKTQSGVIMGTPAYMPPEQKADAASVDFRADIYALGVVIHEMLTGELPQTKGKSSVKLRQYGLLCDVIANTLKEDRKERLDDLGKIVEAVRALANAQNSQSKAVETIKNYQEIQAKDVEAIKATVKVQSRQVKMVWVIATALAVLVLGFVVAFVALPVLYWSLNLSEPESVSSNDPQSPLPARIVQFPDHAIGVYGVRPWGSDAWPSSSFAGTGPGGEFEPAHGSIAVDDAMELWVRVEGVHTNDLSFMDDWPEDTLQGLSIQDYSIQDGDIARISRQRTLRFLRLDALERPADELRSFANLSQLKTLEMARAKLPLTAWSFLRDVPALLALDVNASSFNDAASAFLADSSQLRYLNLGGCNPVTDVTMDNVRQNTGMRELLLNGTEVTDDGLAFVAAMTRLERLHLGWCNRITDRGLESLADLQSLRVLDISGPQITDTGTKAIARLRGLRELGLLRTHISDAGFAELNALPLETLSLEQSDIGERFITDVCVDSLLEMRTLNALNLIKTAITPMGLARLKALPHLSNLGLDGLDFQPGAIEALASLEHLEILAVAYREDPIPLEYAEQLHSLKQVKRYVFSFTPIDDSYLGALSKLTHADMIRLDGTKLTDAAKDELRKRLPDVMVI